MQSCRRNCCYACMPADLASWNSRTDGDERERSTFTRPQFVRSWWLSACGLTCGCRIGPEYTHPTSTCPTIGRWPNILGCRRTCQPPRMVATLPRSGLDQLVGETYEQNLSLRGGGQRILEARAYGAWQSAICFRSNRAPSVDMLTLNQAPTCQFLSAPGVFQPD